MITNHIIPEDAVLVAIDIAKARNDVLIEVRGNKRRKRLVVLNTRAEHDRFIDMLASFDRPVVAGCSATFWMRSERQSVFPVSDCETDRPNCLRRISGSS